MTENIPVTCLLDRYWNSITKTYDGISSNGLLIDISMESAEEDPGELIPVGIVLLEDNTFHSVPMEFITKRTA